VYGNGNFFELFYSLYRDEFYLWWKEAPFEIIQNSERSGCVRRNSIDKILQVFVLSDSVLDVLEFREQWGYFPRLRYSTAMQAIGQQLL